MDNKSLYRLTKDAADAVHDKFYALRGNWPQSREQAVAIYLATCKVTEMQYVGQSLNVWGRIGSHLHSALRDNSKTEFHCALREHGSAAFEWRLLAIVAAKVADETETLAIQSFKTLSPLGYNKKFAVCSRGYWGVDLRQQSLEI